MKTKQEKNLNKSKLQKFLHLAGAKLKGDWILVGGSLLPALGREIRATEDIDLIGFGKLEQAQTLELMEVAESMGMPAETINQSAGLFLRKISGWKKSAIILHKGKSATIYRPDLNLYIRLKLDRLAESDLSDCLEFLKYAQSAKEPMEIKELLAEIRKKSKTVLSDALTHRLKKLETSLLKYLP